MSNIRNISELVEPTHDEHQRQKFISNLRRKILVDFANDMRVVYEKKVAPKVERRTGRKPKSGRDIRRAMLHEPIFEAWSSLRYNAQFMTWWSVQPAVERVVPAINQVARDAREANPAGGSLELDARLKLPQYVTQLDVHQMPGCFQTEFTKDDASQGAVYHKGSQVFFGGFGPSITSDIARSIAHFVKLRNPKFKPKRILDIGCTAGANTAPYLEVFPDAEVHGIDVGAPMLRYGHALAEATGKPIHFHQQDAEHPKFPDGHFDLITSSFFFHEVSVPATHRILKGCYRMLKPGGLMIHMELPPASHATEYQNFYYDWDAFYNNEPHYEAFRNLDFIKTLTKAGFKKNKLHFEKIPNWSYTPRAEFEAVAKATDKKERFHGHGRAWFTFGGWK